MTRTTPSSKPKVTVYIPSHNYGRYVEKAIASVYAQTLKDWELIIINDGSTDDTAEILKKYEDRPNVRVVTQSKKGLPVSNNVALRLANAPYLMRLDADDFLDENALLVMSHILDENADVGLVYPDFYLVDDQGEVLELVRRKKIGVEAKLLDLPAHGACTMIRKRCLLELGGYEESITCQDGYDLWLRFLKFYKPYNVNIPLFYYRQHEGSLTKNQKKILRTRASVKRNFVKNHNGDRIPRTLGLIPVAKRAPGLPDSPFTMVAGKPLLWHTLSEALAASQLERVVVTSNDPQVLEYAKTFPGVGVIRRPDRLVADTRIAQTVEHALGELKKKAYKPEAVMLLYSNCPLRRAMHIQMAIDTMAIFNVDSVVSVVEELSYCYHHGPDGLTPIQRYRDVQIEKKSIYRENGAVLLARVEAIHPKNFVGKRVGHFIMLPEESVRIRTQFDLWQTEKIATEWAAREEAAPPPVDARR